jgi:Rod binding domain-containing protein
MEYAQEMFAQAMASKGGLGIANMVTKGLATSGDSHTDSQAVQQ